MASITLWQERGGFGHVALAAANDPKRRSQAEFSFEERFQRTMGSHTGYPSLAEIAGSLNVSTRTLKRRLGELGTSFRDIQNERRSRESFSLLRDTSLSVEQIAWQLGYSSGANFTRAFRRWTGKSPASWRREVMGCSETSGSISEVLAVRAGD